MILVATLNPQSRWLTQAKSDSVADVLTGKDKATIYVTMKSRTVRLLQTKSASDFDGRKVHHKEEHLIMHHELCHYLQLSVISYHFHIYIV